ncbi:MAG TPA: hypothetical protein VND62_00120 [Acidimicrobiales bacterium]|nr:hypothetical protein [Acidimicrobiales bacterium]
MAEVRGPRRPPHRRFPRRRGAIAAAFAAGAALALAGCSPATRATTATTTTATTTATTATSSTSSTIPRTTTTVAPATTTTTDPGLLPQTPTEPPVGSPLQGRLAPLWAAIVSGSSAGARGEFFPKSAYLAMKTGVIPTPASDYADRLVAFYTLDLGAYHAALGSGAAGAQLVGVDADPSYAAWIPSGACENLIGYWHLPGVRIVYRENGQVRSFAVASLISWRGVWYVVHLGPNPRPENVGTVDLPATGPGIPGPPGGC